MATKIKMKRLSVWDYYDDDALFLVECPCCGQLVTEDEGFPVLDPADIPSGKPGRAWGPGKSQGISRLPITCPTLRAVRDVRRSDSKWFADNPDQRLRPRRVTRGEQLLCFVLRGWLVDEQEVRRKVQTPKFGPSTWDVQRRPLFPVQG